MGAVEGGRTMEVRGICKGIALWSWVMERRKEKEGIYWSGNAEKIKVFFSSINWGDFYSSLPLESCYVSVILSYCLT